MDELILDVFVKMLGLCPLPSGRVMPNFYAVKTGTVNFFIYRDDQFTLCFDSGFNRKLVRRELKRLEINPSSITDLFLTHSDIDHQDGLVLLNNARVYLCADEQQMVNGTRARMFGFVHNPQIRNPIHLLHDNETLTIGSTRVKTITTPGHTPGSICYLINESILIAGDAFKLVNGKVQPRKAYITMDMELQKQSIRKLAGLINIKMICTAHDGCSKHFDEAFSEWKIPNK
jgi:glyoxylase-like metal-dependent hydrolase (beta-lactamase superfamily II)